MRKNLLLLALLFMSLPAHALFSTFDTTDILPKNTYQFGLEPQIALGGDYPSGFGLIGHFNMPATDDLNFNFEAGAGGIVTFEAGTFVKWSPIPDVDNQPGIGLIAGVVYARTVGGISGLHIRLQPLISKKFDTSAGEFTPYFSVPFGPSFSSGATSAPILLTPGTRWRPEGYKHMAFMAEFGINLNSAFSYVSVGLTVPFDSAGGLKFN